VDGAPLPVYAVNQDAFYVYENEAVRRFLGYELIGRQLTDVLAHDPRLVMASFERLKPRGYLSGRARYRHRDGSPRNADVNIFMQNAANETMIFVSLLHPLPGVGPELPRLLEPGIDYGFTTEEMRLLMLISEGFSDEDIGTILTQTSNQVARLVEEVLAKMNAASRTEAAVLAFKNRVIV